MYRFKIDGMDALIDDRIVYEENTPKKDIKDTMEIGSSFASNVIIDTTCDSDDLFVGCTGNHIYKYKHNDEKELWEGNGMMGIATTYDNVEIATERDSICMANNELYATGYSLNNKHGMVFKYTGTDDKWDLLKLKKDDRSVVKFNKASRINMAISKNGTTMVLSYPEYLFDTGIVEVYEKTNDTWVLVHSIKNTFGDSEFGKSVAVDAQGDTIVIGSINDESIGKFSTYQKQHSHWSLTHETFNKHMDKTCSFANNMAITHEGNLLAVSAHSAFNYSGLVMFYKRDGIWDDWKECGYVLNTDTRVKSFGRSLAFNQYNILAVGFINKANEEKNTNMTGGLYTFYIYV